MERPVFSPRGVGLKTCAVHDGRFRAAELRRWALRARPYLGLSAGDEADIDKIIDAWAGGADPVMGGVSSELLITLLHRHHCGRNVED